MTMHIGVLGGGNISGTHARAIAAAGCQVAAVWGANRDKAGAIGAEHGAPVYDDLERFLAHRPMDAVAIGSPSGVHGEHVTPAVRRGLHVIVEKPVEISTARVDALLGEAARAGVTLGVFFQDRLKPDMVRLKNDLDNGRAGPPILATAHVKWYRPPEYYSTSRWRGIRALDGGGALMNQGIHTVDTLLWLLGPIESVTAAHGTLVHRIEVEDTLVATLRFTSGALATLVAATSVHPGFPRRIEISGAKDTLVVEDPATSAVVGDATAHQRIVEDFVEAVETGREPVCSGTEGRRSVAVVEAIYEAARSGRAVRPG